MRQESNPHEEEDISSVLDHKQHFGAVHGSADFWNAKFLQSCAYVIWVPIVYKCLSVKFKMSFVGILFIIYD